MDHKEFAVKLKNKRLVIHVNRELALQVMDTNLLPSKYRMAHIFWSWIWILSIPIGIALMFIVKWWIVLLVIFLLAPILSSTAKNAACQNIILASYDIPDFYNLAVKKNLLIIKEKS